MLRILFISAASLAMLINSISTASANLIEPDGYGEVAPIQIIHTICFVIGICYFLTMIVKIFRAIRPTENLEENDASRTGVGLFFLASILLLIFPSIQTAFFSTSYEFSYEPTAKPVEIDYFKVGLMYVFTFLLALLPWAVLLKWEGLKSTLKQAKYLGCGVVLMLITKIIVGYL